MKEDLSYLWGKLIALLGSRKFWVLLFAVLASYGLPISAELQAMIILVAALFFAGSTAAEDIARERATPYWPDPPDWEFPDKELPEAENEKE
jgi:hypothetical protein